jgi:hypothetical protein
MKPLLFSALLFFLALPLARAQTSPAPQTSSLATQGDEMDKKTAKLRGLAVNQLTGEPIRKANLTLKPQPNGTAITAVSDAEGKFSMDNIDPGRYTLSGERQGFVTQNYGARRPNGAGITLDLKASQLMKDVSFKLTPQGVIAGHVLDDEGEPVSGVNIVALQFRYLLNKKRLMPASGGPIMTNDLGEYRLPNLGPGRYYIASTSQKLANIQTNPERAPAKGPEDALVPTYYPNVADAAAASPVDVGPGAEVRGVDVRLHKARVFRVRGKVIDDSTGTPLSPASLVVYGRDAGAMSFLPMSVAIAQDARGSFELKNIPPGSYSLLIISVSSRESKMISLDVTDQDVEDFTAHFGSGVDIPVTAKTDDVAAASTRTPKATLPPARPPI